jgi:hypothetical protein
MPSDAAGKRVRGKLANGEPFGFKPVSDTAPAGWPADGKGACRWSRTGSAADIDYYEVIA